MGTGKLVTSLLRPGNLLGVHPMMRNGTAARISRNA